MSLAREVVETLSLREEVHEANGVNNLQSLMDVTLPELSEEELAWLMVNQIQKSIPYLLSSDIDQVIALIFTRGVQFGRELERRTS